MDEVEKLQAQIKSLLAARKFLLNQQPSDMVAIGQITEGIVDLTARQMALTEARRIPAVSPETVKALQSAIKALDDAMKASAAATQILTAATAVANTA